jgi:hypothetical protein
LAVSKAFTASSKRHRVRDERLEIDKTCLHQLHSQRELLVEPEGAAKVEFLGGNLPHRDAEIATHAELHDHAARTHDANALRQRDFSTGALELHIEISLSGE